MMMRRGGVDNCTHVWQCFARVSFKLLLLPEDTRSCQKVG